MKTKSEKGISLFFDQTKPEKENTKTEQEQEKKPKKFSLYKEIIICFYKNKNFSRGSLVLKKSLKHENPPQGFCS